MRLRRSGETVTPIHDRSWPEVGKWFAVYAGRCAAVGLAVYLSGSALLDDAKGVVREPVEEQGRILNSTLADKGQKIDEVARVAGEVDVRIREISDDWDQLKHVLQEDFGVMVDEPAAPGMPGDSAPTTLPPDTEVAIGG